MQLGLDDAICIDEIAHADEGELAWPIMNLPNSLEGTLTLAPTRLYAVSYTHLHSSGVATCTKHSLA